MKPGSEPPYPQPPWWGWDDSLDWPGNVAKALLTWGMVILAMITVYAVGAAFGLWGA